MSLMDEMMKTGSITDSSTLDESRFFKDPTFIPTSVYALNLALSGDLRSGGVSPGFTAIAGPSKHFKTNICLEAVHAYLEHYDDAICLFYDSEYGALPSYFQSAGIDPKRVLHLPIKNVEEFKFDIMQKLEHLEQKRNKGKAERVIIFVDSIGNLASKKEVDDALDEKSAADMTRAKQLKSVFRMITPYLTPLEIPMFGVNHTYQEIGPLYPKEIMGGGQGPMLSADTVIIVGRQQIKAQGAKEIEGFEFKLKEVKSRFIKENSVIPYRATYADGVDPYSGLLDIAIETGHVEVPKKGWYTRPFIQDDKNWRRKETSCSEFWDRIFEETDFEYVVNTMYALGSNDNTMVDSEDYIVVDGEDEVDENNE